MLVVKKNTASEFLEYNNAFLYWTEGKITETPNAESRGFRRIFRYTFSPQQL
jgi:hypothetical protein